jgi:NADH:ubiquinone oxidoreductase subunit F (NADH-binding)
VNNVETLAWVPAVVMRQEGKWYRDTSLRFFSVSGDVKTPGVHEVPITVTLGGLIDQCCGGLLPEHELHAVATSGPSGGFLPRLLNAGALRHAFAAKLPALTKRSPRDAERLSGLMERLLPEGKLELEVRELPLDVGLFRALDLALGAGIVVYGRGPKRTPRMLDQALNCLSFFAKESCGKCVPCRLGCQQLLYLAGRLKSGASSAANSAGTVRGLARVMETMSICGLGRAASNPLTSFLDYFGAELEGSP